MASNFDKQLRSEYELLIDVFPPKAQQLLPPYEQSENVLEIVADLGSDISYRNFNHTTDLDYVITAEDIAYIAERLGPFRHDGRIGIPGTLHRISRVSDREGKTIGFTFRIGRYLTEKPTLIEDVLSSGKSILIVAPPGKGKSSMLRQIAYILSVEQQKRVIVVDKSSELGGEANPAHYSLGKARRFQVPEGRTQADTMLFALESHFPQVIIVDEISTHQEAQAARTIAQRGVQLIASAHGRKLEDVIKNPPLADVLGGVNIVTLSDENAKQRHTSKTIAERKFEPTFEIALEIHAFDEIAYFDDVTEAVDLALSGGVFHPEIRRVIGGETKVISPKKISTPKLPSTMNSNPTFHDAFEIKGKRSRR